MYKKKLSVVLILMVTMISNIFVYADESTEKYDLKKLKQMYIDESFEVKLIELETKLLQTQYNERIKDYKDFKKIVNDVEDNMNAMKAIREQSILDAKRAYDTPSVEAAAKNAQFALMEYIRMRSQYRLRVREDVQMTQALEPVIFQISIAEDKKQSSIAKSEYDLERDYYNLVTLHRELDLLQKDIENVVKKSKIDITREQMGMITALEKEETEKQIRELERNKEKLENNIELVTKMLETKLNIDLTEDMKFTYEIPKNANTKVYSLKDVTSNLKNNNLDLAAVKNNVSITEKIFNKLTLAYDRIEEYNENQISLKQYESEKDQIKVSEIEFEKAKIQQYNLERNLELYANQTYYEYKAAQEALISNILYNNDMYSSKMNIIELNYKHGLISQIDYDFQKQQLNRELNKLEQDIINHSNAKNKMDLMVKGIMVSGTTSM